MARGLRHESPPRDQNIPTSQDINAEDEFGRRETFVLGSKYGPKYIPIYYLTEYLPFGKYKGEKILNLLNSEDPKKYGWVNWAIRENVFVLKGKIGKHVI